MKVPYIKCKDSAVSLVCSVNSLMYGATYRVVSSPFPEYKDAIVEYNNDGTVHIRRIFQHSGPHESKRFIFECMEIGKLMSFKFKLLEQVAYGYKQLRKSTT